MKKETLINNLQRIADNIPKLELPAEVNGIYAFGSILREKENPHDIDLVVLYSMTQEQAKRWETFRKNFSSGYGDEHTIRKIQKYLVPYQTKSISLCDAVKNEELSSILREHEIEPVWAGCFSWTDVLGYDPYGFDPEINKVLRRMIFGRFKGFQVKFSYGESLPDGYIPMMVAKNHCLAWSKEKPDVKTNLLKRSVDEKMVHDLKELNHFIEDEIPRYKKKFLEAIEIAKKRTTKANIALNWDALESKHVEIHRTGTESLIELAKKCEQARSEMKNYHDENGVLKIIAYTNDFVETGYSIEEQISQTVIQNSKSNNLSEPSARAILHTLGLPEDRIMTIKKYGFGTYYELARTVEEKNKLTSEIERENKRAKLLKSIIKTVRSVDSRAQARLESFENGKPKQLTIFVDVRIDQLGIEETHVIEEDLKKKGFTIRKQPWYLMGLKSTVLQGTETSRELQEIAKKLIS